MATVTRPSLRGELVYNLAGAGITGAVTLGQIPAGAIIQRISIVTVLAGTGSSSPTIVVGISGTTNKYVASATPTVSAGVSTLTVNTTNAIPTAAETIIATFGGTMPTNATYNAYLIVEFLQVA